MNRKDSLKYISETLHDSQISYAIIGAYAVAAWGVVRATKDMDFIADIPSDKVPLIVKEFQSKGFQTELRPGDTEDPVKGVLKLTYKTDKVKEDIDILLGIKGLPKDIYKRVVNIPILGINTPVISAEDLVIAKLLAGNPLDVEDAKKILKVMAGKIDLNFIENFCKEKGLELPRE